MIAFVNVLNFCDNCLFLSVLTIQFLICSHQVIWIKGHGHKRIIVLKNDMKGKGVGSLSYWKFRLNFRLLTCSTVLTEVIKLKGDFFGLWFHEMAAVHCKKIVIKVLCLCVVAKPSCSVSNSPQLENTESPRDSPISSATSGAQSPGNGSHTWLLKVFVVFKDILKKIRSSEISFFLALQKKSWWKKAQCLFSVFSFLCCIILSSS